MFSHEISNDRVKAFMEHNRLEVPAELREISTKGPGEFGHDEECNAEVLDAADKAVDWHVRLSKRLSYRRQFQRINPADVQRLAVEASQEQVRQCMQKLGHLDAGGFLRRAMQQERLEHGYDARQVV